MENKAKMSMEEYMESLANDIEQIKEHPQNGCCDGVEVEVLENVLGIINQHFGDYDTFCSENKAMAEFLESLGYLQEQITHIANGGNPKTEIDLLGEEVFKMEKDGMANNNAIERFNRKIKSLQNTDIAKVAMKKIETSCKQNAMDDIYSSFPENIKTDELWDKIMSDDEFEHEDLVVCELYENLGLNDIREELQVLFNGGKRLAIEAINMVNLPSLNTLSLYKTSVQELSGDVIAMLEGECDYVSTGLGKGSMIFDLDTLKNILSSYEEDNGDENNDRGSDSSYLEFHSLVEKIIICNCKGLFLINRGNNR
jgi:hypothetical protein